MTFFRISVGELLDNRYKSYAFTGKGVFSNVIRCKDKHEKDKDVAIKIIRKNDLMLKAGMQYYFTIIWLDLVKNTCSIFMIF